MIHTQPYHSTAQFELKTWGPPHVFLCLPLSPISPTSYLAHMEEAEDTEATEANNSPTVKNPSPRCASAPSPRTTRPNGLVAMYTRWAVACPPLTTTWRATR